MHREGHLGAALLCYAPLGFVIALVVTVEFAVLGALAAAGFSMVPDLDMRVPGLKHRGVTHTVHFALAFGCGIGLLSAAVAWSAGPVPSLVVGVFGCLVGALTIVSHIAADALTPTGVDPFYRGETISYDVARARNPLANYGLLVLGCGACLLAAWIAGLLGA